MDSLLSGRFENHPPITKANGAWLVDSEGNEILDMVLGCCTAVLGHSNPSIQNALNLAADNMINVGDKVPANALTLENEIKEISKLEGLRFVSSGSEALALAFRLARSRKPKRKYLLKFTGHYHGWFDQNISQFTPNDYCKVGVAPEIGQSIISIEWNNISALKEAFETFGEDIYGAVCEPTLCHAGTIPAKPGFLDLLRKLTQDHEAALIFDECITGFRVELGGAQAFYNVKADIVCYSKTISGGIPIGVCSFSSIYKELLETGMTYQAATYDANNISASAALAVLTQLKTGSFYERTKKTAFSIKSEISALLSKKGISHVVQGHDSVFNFFYTDEESIDSYEQYLQHVDINLTVEINRGLNENRIYCYPGDIDFNNLERSWFSQFFLSETHHEREIEHFVNGFKDVLGKI